MLLPLSVVCLLLVFFAMESVVYGWNVPKIVKHAKLIRSTHSSARNLQMSSTIDIGNHSPDPKSLSTTESSSQLRENGPPYTLSDPQIIYVYMTALFVTCLIVADFIGVKIFELKLPFTIFGYKYIEHTW